MEQEVYTEDPQQEEQQPAPKLSVPEFASKIKTKYPQYKDVPDDELVAKIINKYPQYKDSVELVGGDKKKVEPPVQSYGLGKAEIASIVPKEEPKVSEGFKPTNDEFARRKAHRDVVAQNLINGKIPSLKEFQDKIPKYAQVNQPVSTDTNLPEEVAMQNDSMEDKTAKNEIAAQTKDEAIENTAKKILAQKGIINDYSKPLGVLQYAQLNEEKNKLKEAVENGDAVVTRKKGEAGLNRTIGWWEGLSKGWNEATRSSDEADEFVNNMDAQEKLNFLAKQQEENKHPEYLGEKGNGVGSMGEFVGSNAPFLGKAVAGTILGTAATALAPETGGISTAALPTAMAFLFTAPDMVNQGAMGEIMRRYETLKRMNPDKDELALMQEAEQGKWAGGGAGLATNALLMGTGIKMPVSATGKAVIGKAITKALETSVHMGATTAAVEGVKQLEGNLEGIKSTPEDIAKSMATTFEENATVGLLLHTMTQAVNGAIKLPKALKSAIKYGLKDANPAELGEVLKMNEAQGVVPEGTAEKVVGEVEAYKKALSKTADDLPPEVQASVAGLIEAKDKIIAEREAKDETQRAVYDEKIAAINEQINKTIETGKPYEHEVNELSGETYGEESSNKKPIENNGITVQEPMQVPEPRAIKVEPETPKEEVKSSTTVSSGVEGSGGVGGDVMKGVNDKMRQTKLEMEFKDGDALSFKNEDTEIVIAKPIGADGKYSVTISEKSDSNTGLTINEGKTKLFDTKLEALDYAKELKEQSLKEQPKAENKPIQNEPIKEALSTTVSSGVKGGLNGVESFETSKGSKYVVGEDGKTSRFKTATNEQKQPQDLTVFAKFEGQKADDYLEALHGYNGQSVHVLGMIDGKVKPIETNEDAAKATHIKLTIVDKDGKITDKIEASTEPIKGYSVFDQRKVSENKYEKHIGNEISKINYKENKPIQNEPIKEVKSSTTALKDAIEFHKKDNEGLKAKGETVVNRNKNRIDANNLVVKFAEEAKTPDDLYDISQSHFERERNKLKEKYGKGLEENAERNAAYSDLAETERRTIEAIDAINAEASPEMAARIKADKIAEEEEYKKREQKRKGQPSSTTVSSGEEGSVGVGGDIRELINQSNEFEKKASDAIDRYGSPKNDVEEKQASKDINSIREQRRERDKQLFKDNKTDDKYDDVHDAILSDGEDMPKGYSAKVIDSYYEPIMGRNHTIAEVTNPKGEKYYIDVNTYKRRNIGETYGEQSLKETTKEGSGGVGGDVTEAEKMQFGAGYKDYNFKKENVPTSKIKITEQPSLSEREDLVEDIKKNGIKEPIVVEYDKESDTYYVKNGNNRVAIAKELGIAEVPTIIAEYKEQSLKETTKEGSGGVGGDVEATAKKIVGESAFDKLKKEGYTIEKGKFDSDAYASFFGLHTGVQADEFANAGLRLVKPSEKIKVYRGKGKNVSEGENEGVTWVAEDKKVAENYSNDGNVEEIEVTKPKNPFPNPTDTIHVKGSDVGNKLKGILNRLFREGKVTKEQAIEASKAIDEFVLAAGEESELYSTKTNKKGVSSKYVKALQALGFDGIVQKESYNSGSPFTATKTGNETNTYGIFKAVEQYLSKQESGEQPKSQNKPIQNEPIKEGVEGNEPIISKTEVVKNASPVEGSGEAKAGESGGGKKPPVDTKQLFGEGEEAGKNKKEFDKMTSSIPNSGEVKKYLSGDTIKKYEKDSEGNPVELRNNQEITAQELEPALKHGLDTIEKAKEVFGDDYVNKTLDYIEAENLSPENKALLYVSLENEMAKRLQSDPKNVGLKKLQDLVREKSQAYLRSNSLAINMGRLRKFAETGYDITKVTDRFFSPKEVEQKSAVEKLVQADAETIQKESEEQVQKMSAEGMTPEIEKLVNEGVEKEINKIYDKLPKDKKRGIDKAIAALERFQKSYKGKAYDATGAIPLAIVDAGITAIKLGLKAGAKIADAIELGVNKIKEKWGKEWEKEADFRRDMAELFKEEEKLIEPKEFTKKALIQQGFGKEINVKTKDGVEKREVLDWKKLAGEEGSVDKISANVAKSLATTAMSAEQINAMSDAFIKEYTELRASVVEKGLNEIAARNKTVVTPDQKSAAKKLAEMYNYGLFDKDLAEYQTVLAKTIGVDKLSPARLKEAIDLGKAMSELLSSSFQGKKLTDTELRAAVQRIEELMRSVTNAEANEHGSTALKLADGVQTYMDLAQRMTLNSLKQAAENPLSGKMESLFNSIGYSGTVPKVLNKDAAKLARQIYKEMVLEKGAGYGEIQSTFINKGNVEMHIDKMSDNKVLQAILSTAIGKTTLDAVDSMYKSKITQQKFVYNLIQVLTKDRLIDGKIEKGMSKQDAQNYVAEKLSGQSFKEAQATAKDIITSINKSAGKKIFNESPLFIDRLAHDIVTAALVNGEKVTADMVKASYNSAYKAAGRGLGHVANNVISQGVGTISGKLESRYKEAVKEKEYNKAAALRLTSALFRNVLNPFVGGGTNWVVLKAEKSGLGLLSGLASMAGRGKRIDMTSETGMKNLENAMYENMKIKDKLIRGAVGGAATALSALAFLGIAGTDEYRKWRNKNMWAAKYADLITPEIILASMAKDNDKIKQYFENSVNKNEQMDKGVNAIKTMTSIVTGSDKAAGQAGSLIGSSIGAPVPWRLIRDGEQLWEGISGGEPYKVNSDKPETFLQGYFKAGMLDYMGYAPHPENKWFNDDDMKSKSFVIIKEKGLEPPKEGSIKQYKVDIDDNHPEGIMTQEEYDKFTEKRRDYIKEGIDEIMNKTYEVTEEAKSGKTISYKKLKGRDLEKDLLKEKIDGVSAEATKKAKEDLGLTSKKNKKLVEEF